ncbi:MAG: alpha/beta fold hydrolase [Actinomycetota bacterium]
MANEARYREAEGRLWESVGVTASEQMVRLKRNAVTVRIQEIGDGPPVVFLHGANSSGSSWASLAARLEGFRRIVLDRPGTGLSGPLDKVLDTETLPEFAETVVIDLLDALELESAHLVATSFGGYIALRTAAAHGDRVRRMVHLSWPVGAPVARLPAVLRFMTVPGLSHLMVALPATRRSVRMIFRSIGHGPSLKSGRITEEDIDCYLALLRHTDTPHHEIAMARSLISPLRGLNPRIILPESLLATIRTPTYFLWGEKDPLGRADTAQMLVKRMPNAELEVMAGAGHAPWLDDPDHCAKTISRFLSE